MEKKFRKSGKEKPHRIGAEKIVLSQTKDKLIVRIPLIRRIRPVVVEPNPISIVFQVEHVLVAIRVGIVVWRAIQITAYAICLRWLRKTKGVWLYFMCDQKSTSEPHQVILFRNTAQILREKP